MKTKTLIISFFFLIITFGIPAMSSAQDRQMGGVGITVFTNQNFRGKSSTFRQDVPDLEPLGLNDKISSLRVGPGERWEVCEHSNYAGRCVVVFGEESDLRRNSWNDLISSFRRVGGGNVPSPSNDYIVLFDRTMYRGTPTNFNGPTPDLYGANQRAQSITIGRGVWELCEGRNFTGRCITLERSAPNLAAYRMNNRVSSVRPVGSGGPPPLTSDWYIVIFDRPSYQGNPTNYNKLETNIFQLARSVTIGRGVWELCQGRDFTGRCVVLDRSVPDLRSHNLRQVASVRPVIR